MNDLPAQKLRELIATHGPSILSEPQRVEGWLSYSCPGMSRETNVLLIALRQQVPAALCNGGTVPAIARRLSEETAMADDAATWAVEAWRKAMSNGDERVQAHPPAERPALEARRESPPDASSDDPARASRKLELLRLVERAHQPQDDAQIGSLVLIGIGGAFLIGAIIGLSDSHAKAGSVCFIIGIICIGIGYVAFPSCREGAQRLEQAIRTLRSEFKDEFDRWGGEQTLMDGDALAAIIRRVLAVEDQPASSANDFEGKLAAVELGHVHNRQLLDDLQALEAAYEPWWVSYGIPATIAFAGLLCLAIGLRNSQDNLLIPGGTLALMVAGAWFLGIVLFQPHPNDVSQMASSFAENHPGSLGHFSGTSGLLSASSFRAGSRVIRRQLAEQGTVAPHRGPLVLALGAIGFVFPPLGPAAWIVGDADLRAIAYGRMDADGLSMTTSGRTLGMIASMVYGGIIAVALMSR